MRQSYLAYFRASYEGDRAPLSIGHHFADWNDGAYREALRRFVLEACPMPEVRCVSYAELADWLDAMTSPRPLP